MPTLAELKLTKKDRAKKVRLAKDVIAQLDEEKLVAMRGRFFAFIDDLKNTVREDAVQELAPAELQATLNGVACSTCARGALFVASVRRYNQVPGNRFKFLGPDYLEGMVDDSNDVAVSDEDRFFTGHELAFMERVFEQSLLLRDTKDSGYAMLCIDQALYALDAGQTLRLIMQHLIDQEGEIVEAKLFESIITAAERRA